MAAQSLQHRLTLGVLAYLLLLSLAVAAHGVFVNESVEAMTWESLLGSEYAHFQQRMDSDATYRWTDTELLQMYGHGGTRPIPAPFDLPPGIHDEVGFGKHEYVVLVAGTGDARSVMALDITAMEAAEMNFIRTIIGSSLVLVCLLVLLSFVGVRRLVRPLTTLAQSIDGLAPDRTGQRITVERNAPREAQVIAKGLNTFLGRNDDFVERERKFLRMASHELRTPLAVLISTAEVAIDQQASQGAIDSLQRIIATAHEMQEMVALLLILARDPERLRSMMETVDLSELAGAVVHDHRLLAGAKELDFEIRSTMPCAIQAPRQIVMATIGNLVRNAIENSERGTIRITVTDGYVTVDDPGHGVSDAERGRIYTRLAREGFSAAKGGIGLELISRAAAHLGWRLDIDSPRGQGTRAMLAFRREQGSDRITTFPRVP